MLYIKQLYLIRDSRRDHLDVHRYPDTSRKMSVFQHFCLTYCLWRDGGVSLRSLNRGGMFDGILLMQFEQIPSWADGSSDRGAQRTAPSCQGALQPLAHDDVPRCPASSISPSTASALLTMLGNSSRQRSHRAMLSSWTLSLEPQAARCAPGEPQRRGQAAVPAAIRP